MPMPRKPGPPKWQVLIRVPQDVAEHLESKASNKGYPSLPVFLTETHCPASQDVDEERCRPSEGWRAMTRFEAAVMTAFAGILIGDFADFHEYAEQ